MTRPTSQQAPVATFDSLAAIDALENAGFDRKHAAALSEQLLIAATTPPDNSKIDKEIDDLADIVTKAIREIRRISVGFTILNLAILVAIIIGLQFH